MIHGIRLHLLSIRRLLRVLLVDEGVHTHGLMVVRTHLPVEAAELLLVRR